MITFNTARGFLEEVNDGVTRIKKVEVIRQSWSSHSDVEIECQSRTFRRGDPLKAPFVITATDCVKPRLEAQRSLPAVLLNGGTNRTQFTVSRHIQREIIGKGARCIGCVTGEENESEQRQCEGSISFVSSLAGICLSAALIRELAFPGDMGALHNF